MEKRPLFSDTDEEAERVLIELARAMPPWKKVKQIADTTKACRQFAMAGLRERYPQAPEEELRRRLAALLLDRETVIKAYGWDPEVEGY